MGSGKSTHGKRLAQMMNLKFVDLDRYVEEYQQQTVAQIFNHWGEEKFRELETLCLEQILNEEQQAVISLGGGTICFNNNLALVKQHGLLVYLELPAAALFDRLSKNTQKRPLIKNHSGEQLKTFIEEKLASRKNDYASAHLTINGLSLSTPQLYNSICEYSQKNNLL